MHVKVSGFKNTWKLLSMKMRRATHSLRVRPAGSNFFRNYQRTKGRHAEADKNLFKSEFAL